MSKYKKNSVVKGCVTGIEKYGVFISLDEHYNGLIHISEISDEYVKNINNYVNVGDTIFVKVVDDGQKTNHVKLSIKGIDYRKDGKELKKIEETSDGFNNLKRSLIKWVNDYEHIDSKKNKKN